MHENMSELYLKRGWSMFPVPPRSKEPVKSWKEFQTRLPSPKEVMSWRGQNLGIVCGRISNLAVIDLDGPAAIAKAKELGIDSQVKVKTANGFHLYFEFPKEGIKNSQSKIADGIDVRGEGGYVLAPPSIHPSGAVYTWVGHPGAPLPPFPKLKINEIPVNEVRNVPGWITEALEGLEEGRTPRFTKLVGRFIFDKWLQRDVLTVLTPHAIAVDYDLEKLEALIADEYRRYSDETKTQGSIDVSKLGGRGNGVSDVCSSVGQFMSEITSASWLCAPFIAKASIGFVAGLPETLKTWLMLDLAIEAARGGGKWLGMFPVQKAKVMFVDQERFKGETQRRFGALIKAKDLKPEDLGDRLVIRTGNSLRFDSDPSFQQFANEIEQIKPDLVIIDSFATIHSKDENNRTEAQTIMERAKAIRSTFNCTLIFIDHETKSVFTDKQVQEMPSAFRMAGSVGKSAAAEFVLTVRKSTSGSSIVYHTKSTLATAAEPFSVRVEDVPTGIVVRGQV